MTDGRAAVPVGSARAGQTVAMAQERLHFDGWIGAVGTASGTRFVWGHWPRSPFGPFSDVMIEHPDGERCLLAPSRRIAEFVADTYTFERVEVVPVEVKRRGPRVLRRVRHGARRLRTPAAAPPGSRPLIGRQPDGACAGAPDTG